MYLNNIIDSYKSNFFISNKIKHYIENHLKYIYVYNNPYINIIFVNNKHKQKRYYKNYISEIIKIFIYTIKILNITHNTPITLIFYMTNFKKSLPNIKYDPITIHNVNSGSTTIDNNNNEITIMLWRKQHYKKVLIHELIHAFKYEFNYYELNFMKNTIQICNNMFDVKTDYANLPLEALVEMYAWILYSIYTHIPLSKIIKYLEYTINRIIKHFDKKRIVFQCSGYYYYIVCFMMLKYIT